MSTIAHYHSLGLIEGKLEELEGTFDQRRTQFLAKEHPSKSTKQIVTVNFVNHTEGPLSSYWIDFNGKPKLYHKIGQGQTHEQQTFSGHVWKLVNDETKELKAIYVAPEESEDVVVTEESTMEEMRFKNDGPKGDTDDDDETDTNGSAILDEKEEPQSKSQIFVRDHNVWFRDASGKESQMSSNGTEENPFDKARIIQSPAEDFAVVWQYTPEEEHVLHLRESTPSDQLEPKVRNVQYLKPGDRVRVDRPRLFSLKSKEEIKTSDELFQNPYSIENIGWNDDGTEYRFIFNERGHQHLRLLGIRTTGEVRRLIEEESGTFIDYSSKSYHRLIAGTDEMLWMSERDGYNHLFLFDLKDGKQKNQVTEGNWNVRSVVKIDETSRRVLTEGDGTHEWTFSPNNKFFVDTWSHAGFADRIAWIKAAAETRPWMNTSKVAVKGGSAGGQSAVAALIHHNDFYKVAIADSGCHDNRMDKIWWNEQWMGFPVDKSYEDSSNVVHAEKLQGALMLIVGELDDNVDPASTFQLIKALNDADKDYEFVFIPGGEHCGGRAKFALRRQERFLRQHLLG
ncbi:hypothetical protein K4K61_003184 [Colletotrichum sp. SAR11_59]|nr:hypothetical protein K4K61_003184 [Colletotrichum sp. SAR11_59]